MIRSVLAGAWLSAIAPAVLLAQDLPPPSPQPAPIVRSITISGTKERRSARGSTTPTGTPTRRRSGGSTGRLKSRRVQAELWESRPVWDRLVYPAIVRVFRFRRSSGDSLSITDPSGSATTFAAAPRAMPVSLDLGNTNRVTTSGQYFVHVIATIGTLAEREVDEVGDAVFGRESATNSLGSLGRLVFRTVLKVNDYLQSVSAETRGRKTAGADILRP